MAEDRVQCQRAGCQNWILPATAVRTGGICRPCEKGVVRAERTASVEVNHREVDLYAGVTDVVEIVKLLASPRSLGALVYEKPFSRDIAEFIGSLSPADIERVIELAISYVPQSSEEVEDIGRWLAAWTEADLSPLQQALADAGRLYPPIVFRGAPPAVRDRIVRAMKSASTNRNHALLALAWIGDPEVVDLFARWRTKPPRWAARELYVPPHAYAQEAGWELDADGGRRDLFSRTAFALVNSNDDAPFPVEVMQPADGRCAHCTGPRTTLIRFDLADPRLAPLALPPEVVTCVNCEGNGPAPAPDESSLSWTPAARLVLGERRNPLHAADQFLPTRFSQLGGAPGWIQDAVYPPCPGCQRSMLFIAQIMPNELDRFSDGLFYAFWCDRCRLTATEYQQT